MYTPLPAGLLSALREPGIALFGSCSELDVPARPLTCAAVHASRQDLTTGPGPPRPVPPHPWVQTRVEAGCRRDYMGANRYLCEEKATQLYQSLNVSASLVWLVEPLVPGPPTITAGAVAGGLRAGTLVVTLTPPDFAGYFAITGYTVNCAPARGPTITATGLGRNVGGQVRSGAGISAGAGRRWQRPAQCGGPSGAAHDQPRSASGSCRRRPPL